MADDKDDGLDLRLVAERSLDAVFRLNLLPHRLYAYFSPAIVSITGRVPSEFYADPWLLRDLVVPADRGVFAAANPSTIQPGHLITIRLRHRDGREIWTEHVLWPVREAGKTVAVEGSIRDISKWQRASSTLDRLGRMLSDTFDGLVGIDVQNLRFTEMDPKARDLLGVGSNEISSKGPRDVFDDAACSRILQAGSMVVSGEIDRSSFETVVRRRGRPDHHLIVRMSASNGDPPAVLLILEDLSAQERSTTERVRLEAAIGSATDAIAIIDSSHSFLFANTAFHQLTGYSSWECVGFRPDILRPLLPDETIWTSVAERQAWKGLSRGSGKGNRTIETMASVAPIHEPGGDTVSFVLVLHDVTEERAAIGALAAERRALDRLAESMASLDKDPAPEDVAEALCQATLALPGVGVAMLLDLSVRDEIAILAISPREGFEHIARHLSGSARVEKLLKGHDDGSWVDDTALRDGRPDSPSFSRSDSTTLVLAAIRYADRLVGLLLAAGTAEIGDYRKTIEDLTTSASAIFGSGLIEKAEKRTTRRVITDVLAHRRFRPVFQPIVNLADGGTVGWEATTRFEDGKSPIERFADALRIGMTVDLEAAATRAAVAEYVLNDPAGWLSLNVSATFLESGERLLSLLPGPGRSVVLELGSLPAMTDSIREVIDRLPPNVHLAVDSTSPEMRTLHAVVDLRPAYIKLPMTLIRGIDHDRVRQALVAGLEHFARSSSSELIAVGVETEAELNALIELKVSYAQGNYLGEPGFFPMAGGSAKAGAPTPGT